ncbi:hypothetical protein H0H92_001740 [Tricholoma furcatifolium]|nr:hypothetical protein H0H92_001740 [Tricholoma furcatifolium]
MKSTALLTTDPNRLAICYGTSLGVGKNDATANSFVQLQRSIFQQLTETNHTWKNYVDPLGSTRPDAGYFNWTLASNNTSLIVDLSEFYTDAAAGELPELSFINPCREATNSMHDSGLISDGETLIKTVYEALVECVVEIM